MNLSIFQEPVALFPSAHCRKGAPGSRNIDMYVDKPDLSLKQARKLEAVVEGFVYFL